MAGIRTSINLIDNMSAVLDRITGKNDKMNKSIESAQKTMNRKTDFADKLSRDEQKLINLTDQLEYQGRAVRRLEKEYLKSINTIGRNADVTLKLEKKLLSTQMVELKLAESVEKAGKKLEEQNNQMNRGTSSVDSFSNKLRSLLGVYLGFRGIKKGLNATIMVAAELDQQSRTMQAAFGNKDIGKGYFNQLRLYAIETGKDIEELTDVTRNFMQLTKNTNKLRGLTDIANRMSMRTGNIGSAESLMQEAMRGEFSRLQRSLHLTDSQIEPLKKAVQRGSLDGIISAFDQTLNTAGLTDEIVKVFQDSPLQKMGRIADGFKQKLAETGQTALINLEPVLQRIDEWLKSDNSTSFFNNIAEGITFVTEKAINVFSFISDNWGTIEPIIWGIVSALGAWTIATKINALATGTSALAIFAQTIATQGLGAAWRGLNTAMKANIFILVITAIIGLVTWLVRLWKTNDEFAVGVIRIWNGILNFFDKIPIFFVKIGIAIINKFWDIKVGALEAIDALINGVITGINWLIDKLNKIPGVSIEAIQAVDFSSKAKLEREAIKQGGEKIIEIMESNAAIKAAQREQKALDFLEKRKGKDSTTEAIDDLAELEAKWNAGQQDTLGSIDDNTKSLKKTEEDLKWLRDIAEREVIDRTLLRDVTIEVSNSFGDVRETADVDGILACIEDILEEQINISAEGVHA